MLNMSQILLDWYDRHARVMPWRISPQDRADGIRPDPYRVWMSEVMLQQTTVAAVKDYFRRFTDRWPTVTDLASAQDADVMAEWAGLGYYARARNLLKCARYVVEHHDGVFPNHHDRLLKLPGVGPYTAAAVSSIAFDQPETVVDGNVERVISRLYDIHTPLPTSKPELTDLARTLTPSERPGDYAQAIMDLGATICTPKSPACGICPWHEPCLARAHGTAAELPKKVAKKPKPTRHGIVYIARREDGSWLMETRPDKGLLGGMLAFPTTDWGETTEDLPPLSAEWEELDAEALHTFTHFHLRLRIMTAWIEDDAVPSRGHFLAASDFSPAALPTVFRKAFDLARETMRHN